MSLSFVIALFAADAANAPRSVPVPDEQIVISAQPSGCSGNIIVGGVCLDVCTYPVEIRDLTCNRTARFDEFACSYDVRFDEGETLGSYWQQRMDIIFQNQEGVWLRERALMTPKTYVKGKLQP